MAKLDDESRKRLFSYLYQSFDDDNAGDMDTFVQNFLHNPEIWDALAEAFPDAPVSAIKAVMMEAYGAWQQGQEPPPPDRLN